jgi:hypothetical protein
MLKGIHLTLLIGPAVPIPAPQSVIDAITSISVTNGKDRGGFQITFAVSKESQLLNVMLPAGYFDPITTRVIVVVTLNSFPNVLIDGIVTRQELTPSSEPGQSTLTITGEDLSVLMDIVELPKLFPAMPEVAQINLLLAPYAVFGIVPVVIPPFIMVIKLPTNQIDSQPTGMTDRAYIQTLARSCGYVFYIEPGPLPGANIAYFGPDIRLPVPQPALNVNMDAHTNVESLSFSLDGLAKKLVIVTIFDPITKKIPIPIPVPNVSIFKPPLGARPTPPARIEFKDLTSLKPDEAAKKIVGMLINNSDAISASGSLDVLRYGNILRARMLVGVRGAGLAYDGMYYVNSVTHNIKRGSYKINFTLSRDGLISNTPKVVP